MEVLFPLGIAGFGVDQSIVKVEVTRFGIVHGSINCNCCMDPEAPGRHLRGSVLFSPSHLVL